MAAFWVIQLSGQDKRPVFAQVKQTVKGYKKKPLTAATRYASQGAANAAITALGLGGRHPEAIAIQRT